MILRVQKSLYSKEVLLKTAYSMTDRVYLHLEQNKDEWIVSWEPKSNCTLDPHEFENELIAQSLRESLLEQSADLRKIIVARAFASTLLDNAPGDTINEATDYTGDASMAFNPEITEKEKESILKGWFD